MGRGLINMIGNAVATVVVAKSEGELDEEGAVEEYPTPRCRSGHQQDLRRDMKEADLLVIGGGSGGVRAARVAASYGAKVMLAEEHRIGGTCVIRGCVPKKLFVYASRFADDFRDSAGYGWTVEGTRFNWATLVANKNKEIARLEAAYTANLDRVSVEHVKSRASFHDGRTVRLEASGELVRASNVLIATGSWPHPGDPIPGIEHAISSNEVFEFRELPRSIVVQGGGYIAVEFACVFAGLGSSVTLVYRGENILRGFDGDVRSHLKAELERKGIRVLCGAKVTSITSSDGGYRVGVDSFAPIIADKVLFALGRRPNTGSLHLDRAGVEVAAGGAVKVDRYSQSTTPGIFAVGDVTNRVNLTPVAIREGHAFADTVFGDRPTAVDHTGVPTVMFSVARGRGGGHDRRRGGCLARAHRRLQDDIPADEGDAVRQRFAVLDEVGRRWPFGTRRRLPHRGAGCRRAHSGDCDRRADARIEVGLRCGDGGASDRGRGTGDDASTHLAAWA